MVSNSFRGHESAQSSGLLCFDMCAGDDRYGSREFGNMAMSCEQEDGLHVIPTAAIIEILRPDGSPAEPGELGEIVITSLTARAMPMIRYRIGDTGVWAEDEYPSEIEPNATGKHRFTISHVASPHEP